MSEREAVLEHLLAAARVRSELAAGQLEDVDPGAGRVFGLMSVVALPRRLSLDFRDVFDSGFSFDQITGSFRLVNGEAFTCDLTLISPAADVGIVGRAGLASRDYSQTALVSANVGNTLPVAGYVIAGPQVAAALLIFSQIFKKPLQEVGQVYYSIDGSWDEAKALQQAEADPDIRAVLLTGEVITDARHRPGQYGDSPYVEFVLDIINVDCVHVSSRCSAASAAAGLSARCARVTK